MMCSGSQSITIRGQQLVLLAQRAIYWRQCKTVLIADPHFGKPALFRADGVPVPPGTTADDLKRLDRLLEVLQPQRLVILGDLLHGPVADARQMLTAVARWRNVRSNLEMMLVAGNHDRRAGELPPAFRLDRVVTEWFEEPFVFTHRPQPSAGGFVLAGHLHPAVQLIGKAGQKETLPCFWLREDSGLLPAFGSFTGSHVIRPGEQDRIFVIAGDQVVPVGA